MAQGTRRERCVAVGVGRSGMPGAWQGMSMAPKGVEAAVEEASQHAESGKEECRDKATKQAGKIGRVHGRLVPPGR
ncbi:MAG: hypothetical protein NVSMB65_18550 [Chloroflexota bacterium]